MNWGHPSLLSWLWLVPAVGLLLYFFEKRRMARLAMLAEASMLPRLLPSFRPERRRLRLLLWLAAFTLLLTSMARPQWGTEWREVRRRGLDILFVLDTSRSMLAEDMTPNRLQRAKWGIRDMLDRLHGDRAGLIPFAGSSFLLCPLTIDYGAFLMSLDDVHTEIIPRGGTAIEQALRLAVDSFDEASTADRVILLITDGEDHEGDPLSVIPELRAAGIKVFAIGVGTPDGELIPIRDERGQMTFLRDRRGNIVRSALREDILVRLAEATGGDYVRATPADFGVERIIEKGFATLKRAEHESTLVRESKDRYGLFVWLAFLLLVGEAVTPERVRTRAEAST